ncbi:hypothetical protein NMG60_11028610 [Bertholletia excelsa]
MTRVSRQALLGAALVLVVAAGVTEAVTCDPTELRPCALAMTTPLPPSKQCCKKFTEQVPCLCGYYKDPNFKQYVNVAKAQSVASKCGVSLPPC